jgi:predicted permease
MYIAMGVMLLIIAVVETLAYLVKLTINRTPDQRLIDFISFGFVVPVTVFAACLLI